VHPLTRFYPGLFISDPFRAFVLTNIVLELSDIYRDDNGEVDREERKKNVSNKKIPHTKDHVRD
jgi:hypothetical protein